MTQSEQAPATARLAPAQRSGQDPSPTSDGRLRRHPATIRPARKTPACRGPRRARRPRLGPFGPDHGLTELVLEVCRTRRLRSAPSRADPSGRGARPPRRRRIWGHLPAEQRRPIMAQRHNPQLEVTTCTPARRVRAPGLAPARPSAPRSTTSPDMTTPTTLSDCRTIASRARRRALLVLVRLAAWEDTGVLRCAFILLGPVRRSLSRPGDAGCWRHQRVRSGRDAGSA
jgi:hypothetical protein